MVAVEPLPLPPTVAAAAGAILRMRWARTGGSPDVRLQDVPFWLAEECIDEARAVVSALDALPPTPRASGALRAADASAIGLSLGLGTLCLLGRDRVSQPSGVLWAVGAGATVLTREQSSRVWAAVTGTIRDFPDLSAPPAHQESAP